MSRKPGFIKLKDLTLASRIGAGYLVLFLCMVAIGLLWVQIQGINKKIDAALLDVHIPVQSSLRELSLRVEESREVMKNLSSSGGESEAAILRKLHKKDFNEIKTSLSTIVNSNLELTGRDQIQRLINELEQLIAIQQRMMNEMVASLNDEFGSREIMRSIYAAEAEPQLDGLLKSISSATLQQASAIQYLQNRKSNLDTLLTIGIVIAILLFGVVGYASWKLSTNSINRPLKRLMQAIDDLGHGRITTFEAENRGDEIGQMSRAVQETLAALNRKAAFAQAIGKGNFDHSFQSQSEEDTFGAALIEMRENLHRNALEEQKRAWTNQGLTEVSNLLRQHSGESEQLYPVILSYIIKYMNANQGALFNLEGEENQDLHLRMMTCFAYNKRKYQDIRVEIGEGLVGQCAEERETFYLTDIPANYIAISSGLGHSLPRTLLLVPLKLNDEVQGVIEIASFEDILPYQIQFMEKVAEAVAATISMVRMNERTKKLLFESQQQTEEMRAQEEEMRQNMEELAATQEEIHRRSIEMNGQMQAINSTLCTAEFSVNGVCQLANENMVDMLHLDVDSLLGSTYKSFCDPRFAESPAYNRMWERLNNGQALKGEYKFVGRNGKEIWAYATFTPVANNYQEYFKVIMLASDVTQAKTRNLVSDTLLDAVSGVLAVAEMDDNFVITKANEVIERMLRYDKGGMEGLAHQSILVSEHPDNKPAANIKAAMLKGETDTCDLVYQRTDGSPVFVRVRYAPVIDLNKNLTKVVLFAVNQNKVRYLEEEIQKLRAVAT